MGEEYHVDDREVASCWDGNAEVWAKHVNSGYDTYRDLYNNPAFFEIVGDLSNLTVLDAGCGEGYNTRKLAKQGVRIVAVDISAKMIEFARLEEQREPLGIRYEVASISNLAIFADEQFDAVVSTMALMDCADYAAAIRELWRVLTPQGIMTFNVLHPCFTNAPLGWEHDQDGSIIGIRLGNYFQKGAYMESWQFGAAPESERQKVRPFTVIYFHRTLADFLNPLCGAGFRIEAIAEPRPTDEACKSDSRLSKHQLIPHFLCVRARKLI
ncbi:class I SAM-dependent methyltransferase [Chloroflexota bacterium]